MFASAPVLASACSLGARKAWEAWTTWSAWWTAAAPVDDGAEADAGALNLAPLVAMVAAWVLVLALAWAARGCLRFAWSAWRFSALAITVASIAVHGPALGVPAVAVRAACAVEVAAWLLGRRRAGRPSKVTGAGVTGSDQLTQLAADVAAIRGDLRAMMSKTLLDHHPR